MKKTLLFLLAVCMVSATGFSQNVGIGTATPQSRLQVNFNSNSPAAANGMHLVDSGVNTYNKLRFSKSYHTTGMNMGLFTAANTSADKYFDIFSDSMVVATFQGNGRLGVRKTLPEYPLDVNGDINTTGTLRVNGNAGTDGQVLFSNGNGTMAWGNMCEFKNIAILNAGTSASWPIPVGTKRLWVELWGGGGCGHIYAGGGGGAYISAFIDVLDPNTPGSLTYTVGNGGTGGSGANGSGSSVAYTNPSGLSLQAGGGIGPSFTAPASVGNGFGGNISVLPATFSAYTYERGKAGQAYTHTIHSAPAATYEVVTGGRGGDAGNAPGTGALSNQLIYNLTAGATVQITNALGNGTVPGGGGGSGLRTLGGTTFLVGSGGANGLILVHY